MDRLNYFNPYQSISNNHENQLTRAYLVLLKHSSHSFFTFMEYCRSKHKVSNSEEPISILNFLENGWQIETQKVNPNINTNFLLSILMTDAQVETNKTAVQSSERNAVYDGIITFGNSLTMIIENKPRSGNIWFEQLNPSRKNLADDTIVYLNPVILEWKEIIKQLSFLLTIQTISGYEKIMIEDFLSFIDDSFPYLNPYDNFYQCKGNGELLDRRISNLLKSIALDESKVAYHRNWGYYIETSYSQIQQIGLILIQDEKGWKLELSLYFGASQRQAISFYNSNPGIEHLKNTQWRLFPNFHVSFMTSNLVWFPSNDYEYYLEFWKNNTKNIYQQKKADVPNYLKWLIEEKVIQMPKEKEEELGKKFNQTEMKTLNICPEFGFMFTFHSLEAEELDKAGKMKFVLAEKIREVLKVVGLDGNDLLKQF